ncbi:MAG: hypothetical protein M3220_10955 [Chloroflexota bacterium]|nr:hypothetical protein [Chloroflexota bacterium]
MLLKALVPLLFIGTQFIIAWYGNFTGRLPTRGSYLGISYDSVFLRTLLVQMEYIWLLILINVLFSLGFHLGFSSYKNFLVIAVLYIASGPIAALLFNSLFVKEKLDGALVLGIAFVVLGSILVVAHKEVLQLTEIVGQASTRIALRWTSH